VRREGVSAISCLHSLTTAGWRQSLGERRGEDYGEIQVRIKGASGAAGAHQQPCEP